jgi:hypothetical protein
MKGEVKTDGSGGEGTKEANFLSVPEASAKKERKVSFRPSLLPAKRKEERKESLLAFSRALLCPLLSEEFLLFDLAARDNGQRSNYYTSQSAKPGSKKIT